jgi:hypothetical protein
VIGDPLAGLKALQLVQAFACAQSAVAWEKSGGDLVAALHLRACAQSYAQTLETLETMSKQLAAFDAPDEAP